MEHGHANHLSDDWSTTAYWYQTLPTKPFGIQSVEERIPLKLGEVALQKKTPNENDEMKAAHKSMSDRGDIFYPAQRQSMSVIRKSLAIILVEILNTEKISGRKSENNGFGKRI